MSFQTTKDPFSLTAALRRGVVMARSEGILSLWRGHSTTVLRVAPYAGLSYAIHDMTERELKEVLGKARLPFFYKFLAGSIAGAGATLLTYPLDVLRVRLALTHGSSWGSALAQGGLFQGLLPTMLGIVPYSGTAWSVKNHILDQFFSGVDEPPTPGAGLGSQGTRGGIGQGMPSAPPTALQSLVINAVAGLVGQFVTYPLDIVRRRMQLAQRQTSGQTLPSMLAVLRHLVETEGLRGLGKGFSLNIIKGPITLSLSFTTYDILRKHKFQDSERPKMER